MFMVLQGRKVCVMALIRCGDCGWFGDLKEGVDNRKCGICCPECNSADLEGIPSIPVYTGQELESWEMKYRSIFLCLSFVCQQMWLQAGMEGEYRSPEAAVTAMKIKIGEQNIIIRQLREQLGKSYHTMERSHSLLSDVVRMQGSSPNTYYEKAVSDLEKEINLIRPLAWPS